MTEEEESVTKVEEESAIKIEGNMRGSWNTKAAMNQILEVETTHRSKRKKRNHDQCDEREKLRGFIFRLQFVLLYSG